MAVKGARVGVDIAKHVYGNRVLQGELRRVREEKDCLEAEALALQRQNEATVNSFEGVIEANAAEKSRLEAQLHDAREELVRFKELFARAREMLGAPFSCADLASLQAP